MSLTDPTGMSVEGGGKDGKTYEILDDGLLNVNLADVQITDKRPERHWTRRVRDNFQSPYYFGVDESQRGKGSGMCTINWSADKAILVLDVIGMSEIPGLSQLADLASGAISAYEGDYVGSGLSSAAMMPFFGSFATAGKWANKGRKVLNHADEAMDVASNIGKYADDATAAWSKYWNKTKQFAGNKVFLRNDLIDPKMIDQSGLSNLDRMKKGMAPLGPDGNPMNLHHMLQTADGPIAEVSESFHRAYSSIIHINPSSIPTGVDRNKFRTWREAYWKNRALDF